MYARMVERISGHLSRQSDKDQELIAYGIEVFLLHALSVVGFLAVGLIFNRLLDVAVWAAALMSVRMPAGGYHASTRMRCQIITFLECLCGALVMPLIPLGLAPVLGAITLGVVWKVAPVIDENQPLSAQVAKGQRRNALIAAVAQIAILAACFLITPAWGTRIAAAVSVGGFTAALLAILGLMKNRAAARAR